MRKLQAIQMNFNEDQIRTIKQFGAIWAYLGEDGQFFTITPLAYHVVVYVEPNSNGGFDDRYCFSNADIAKIAIKEFERTGVMRYWQKHHNANISVVDNYAYAAGTIHIPEYAMHAVDWNASEISAKYSYDGP